MFRHHARPYTTVLTTGWIQVLDFYIFNHKSFLKPANLLLSLSTLTSFAKLPRLRLHSFRFNTVSRSTTLPLELLSHLPPTVARIEIPEYIPFQPLLAFLHNPSLSSIRVLGISEIATSASRVTMEITALLSACREKDIRIEYIFPDQDLFRESSIRSLKCCIEPLLTLLLQPVG